MRTWYQDKSRCKSGLHALAETRNKQGKCRLCLNERARGYRAENPEDRARRAAKEKLRRQNKKEEIAKQKQNRRLVRKYGITIVRYLAMFEAQKGVCAICHRPQLYRLCVDHDHTTGEVRGLLCRPCNVVIGLLGDSPTRLDGCKEYLRRHAQLFLVVSNAS